MEEVLTEFEQLVQDDIRSQLSDNDRYALIEENPEAWYDALQGIVRRIDAQLSSHKAERARIRRNYDDILAKKLEWRSSAIGFRALAEKRLSEARRVLGEQDEPLEIVKLQDAIRHHRQAVESDLPSVEAERVDHELWSIVE